MMIDDVICLRYHLRSCTLVLCQMKSETGGGGWCHPQGAVHILAARVGFEGYIEKHNFSSSLLENSREHHGIAWFSVNSHKASPLGPISELAVIVPWQC